MRNLQCAGSAVIIFAAAVFFYVFTQTAGAEAGVIITRSTNIMLMNSRYGAIPQSYGAGNSDGLFAYTADMNKSRKPPLSAGRVTVEFLSGGVSGIVVGALGAFIGGNAITDDSGWASLAGAAGGFIIGYPIGVSAGVYTAGTWGDQDGEWWAATLGSAAGVGLAVLLADETYLGPGVLLLFPPIGSVIGFNMTRRYDDIAAASQHAIPRHISKNIPAEPAVYNTSPDYRHINLVTLRW